MEEIIKDLNILKDEIAKSKSKTSQLEGRKEELMKRLKSEFGLVSLPETQKKIGEDSNRLEKLRLEIEKKYNELNKQFVW